MGLKLSEIRDLSPRQISEIYFRKRAEDGSIEPPKTKAMPGDPKARIRQLFGLISAGIVKVTAEQMEELKRRVNGGT